MTKSGSAKPLRIVLVSHYSLPHLGGIEVVVDQLARGYTNRGHVVTHIAAATTDHEPLATNLPYELVRVRAWNPLEQHGIPYPLFAPGLLLQTIRQATGSADVIHAHGFLYASSLLALLSGSRRYSPVRVLTEHVGIVPYVNPLVLAAERIAVQTLGRLSARSADTIITLNASVTALMQSLAPGVPVEEIPNGVDIERYRPADPGEKERLRASLGMDQRPAILFAGRLVEKKGAHLVIQMSPLSDDFQYVLAGPGELRVESPNLRFLGPQTQQQLAEVYRACDVFVLPSHGEGFPLTAMEAMASGLPIVLSDDPTYSSLLQGAEAVVRLTPRDPVLLLEAARELLLTDQPTLSAAAAAFSRASFSWTVAVERHLQLYSRLIEGGKTVDHDALSSTP